MKDVYHKLTIFAGLETDIWLGDEHGHFVAKHTGVFEERLRPGQYVVSFGVHSARYVITLDRDLTLTQETLKTETTTMTEVRRFGVGHTIAVVLTLILIFGLLAAFNSAKAEPAAIPTTCTEAADTDALTACLRLLVPETGLHTMAKTLTVLGQPLGVGSASACPKDATGQPVVELCQTYPSTVHRIGDDLVVAVYATDDPHYLLHIAVASLTEEGIQELERKIREGAPIMPGYQPVTD